MSDGGVKPRYQPVFRHWTARSIAGFAIAAGSAIAVSVADATPFWMVCGPALAAWAVSAWMTDKYRHKYPQRYYPYLAASHGKAAAIAAGILAVYWLFAPAGAPVAGPVRAVALAAALDVLLSIPRTRMRESAEPGVGAATAGDAPRTATPPPPLVSVNASDVLRQAAEAPAVARFDGLVDLIAGALPESGAGESAVRLADENRSGEDEGGAPAALFVQIESMNAVRRLNLTLRALQDRVQWGGFFAFRYRPLDEYLDELRISHRGPDRWLRFAWHFVRHRALPKSLLLERLYFSRVFSGVDDWRYRRRRENRRVVSRAEMWGRMYYWGFEVLKERRIGDDHWVVARRVREPERVRTPTFAMLARLTKVGLDGQPLRLHKIRTMYPFSEFLQERVYRDHGLSETGKFRNDFRLTDYGRFLRRYWLDEIPQIVDWLRGEIKLVGMRATSPHFLSLYPRDVYDLYIRTKPGLVPPIFDASTAGFDDIVRVESEYLRAYQRSPVSTDVRYLFRTLHDIFIRGIRSK